MMRNFIFFKTKKTGLTGRKIRDELGISSQLSYRGDANKVIRWGNSRDPCSTELVLNKQCAIEKSANKKRALEIMKSSGVRVPYFLTDKEEAEEILEDGHTLLGRTTYHQGGKDITVINNVRDLRRDHKSSHWVIKKDIVHEYRVHVFQGEIIGISRKTDEGVVYRISNAVARNHANGWRFVRCDIDQAHNRLKEIAHESVVSLGLDFGAVDVILANDGNSRRYYVLEVNSAPSLEEGSTILYSYINKFKRWLSETS